MNETKLKTKAHRTPSPTHNVDLGSEGADMPNIQGRSSSYCTVAAYVARHNPAPNASQPLVPSGVVCIEVQS